MPNWVTNKLTIQGTEKQVKEVLAAIAGDVQADYTKECIDFNKIIPMPEDLRIEAGSRGMTGVEYIKGESLFRTRDEIYALWDSMKESEKEQCLLLGAKYIANTIRYDTPSWYEWRIEHWGTKWNACEARLDGNDVWFDTAWSTSQPVIETLSKKFPKVVLNVEYADENLGDNVGIYAYKAGEKVECEEMSGENKGVALAIHLKGLEDQYELIDGEYRYIE